MKMQDISQNIKNDTFKSILEHRTMYIVCK